MTNDIILKKGSRGGCDSVIIHSGGWKNKHVQTLKRPPRKSLFHFNCHKKKKNSRKKETVYYPGTIVDDPMRTISDRDNG